MKERTLELEFRMKLEVNIQISRKKKIAEKGEVGVRNCRDLTIKKGCPFGQPLYIKFYRLLTANDKFL